MKKVLTIASAIKRVKMLENEKSAILRQEEESCVYEEVNGVVVDTPAYDLSDTEDKLRCIDQTVRNLKHAINLSNAQETVAGIGMTPDVALVAMAQYNARLKVLDEMAVCPPRKREKNQYGSSSAVVITVRNYDAAQAKAIALNLRQEVSAIQMALDAHNLSKEIEYDELVD